MKITDKALQIKIMQYFLKTSVPRILEDKKVIASGRK